MESAIRNPQSAIPFFARYARGRDYHKVLKNRCIRLMDQIRQFAPQFEGRAFVDSAPIMERSLAARAGLGFIGRNGCLIVPGLGSYVLLCEIVCNLSLVPDEPLNQICEGCDRCVRACPTNAIGKDSLVDARRCLSYHTIENRGQIPQEFWDKMGNRVFGCDACQEACPLNESVPPGDAELLVVDERGRRLRDHGTLADILRWTPEDWDAATRGSATRRATHEMFLRNAILAAGNSNDPSLRQPLDDLRQSLPQAGPLIPMIGWAIERLANDLK